MRFNKEQIYIVTGASSGIGRAVALLLNKHGANVVALARREDALKSLVYESNYPENMHYEVKDLVSNIEQLPEYIKGLKEKYGKFNGLAYCAGIGGIHSLRTLDINIYNTMFYVNYLVPIYMTKGITDKRNNNGAGTSIVYISSLAGTNPMKGQILYAGSKGALIASVKSISKELAPRKIRCNTISPSWVNTRMYDETKLQYSAEFGKYPLGMSEPDDIANLVSFLLSEESAHITGCDYIIDSGGGIGGIYN